jgi:L-ascorbate metabolism protein UlaG (beta-lactamase superfamily)
MELKLLRNATLKLDYAGSTILIDPFFAPKHSQRSITGRSANPMTDLPVSTNEILAGVELVLVSHLHADHFDSVAQERTPKHLPLICQPGDEEKIRSFGFTNVTPLTG